MDNLKAIYLSNSGRLARLPYFLYALGLAVAYIVLMFLLAAILGHLGILIAYLLMIFPFFNLMAKRLQDFDKPGKWAWGVIAIGVLGALLGLSESMMAVSGLVSLLHLIVALIILFMPGTPGANSYGPQPGAAAG